MAKRQTERDEGVPVDRVKEAEARARYVDGRALVSSAPASCKVQTPPPLAQAMAQALGDNPNLTWLEPCVGEGVFLLALAGLDVTPNRITAIDLDSVPGVEDERATTLRGIDFIDWSFSCGQKFDRIIGNPPFVSLSKLERRLQEAALRVESPSGLGVPLSSNYWYVFLCASLNLLRFGGSLAFVLPASWDYADYARNLRSEIAEKFERVEIYRSKRPLFASVQEGSIVLLAFGFGLAKTGVTRFVIDNSIEFTENTLRCAAVSVQGIPSATKLALTDRSLARLGDVIDLKLGGVTGAASFFLLTEEQRRSLHLPVKSVRPVLSKARHLIAGQITVKDWQFLRDDGQRIWLFDPPTSQTNQPAVKRYLESVSSNGSSITKGYKISIRDPWYRTPLPRTCHGFVSGMSRNGPWICLNGFPRLSATNTLYTVTFRRPLPTEERFAWALSMMTTEARRILLSVGRVYPDGLVKYEPGDLSDLILRRPKRVRGAKRVYERVIRLFLAGDIVTACALADNFGWE